MTDEATKLDDGGPAFPHIETTRLATTPGGEIEVRHTDSGSGMSLRDWFAGQALAGLMVEHEWEKGITAEIAYDLADAMLAARAKVRP